MRPVEGTILTVVREIAEALEALDAPSLVDAARTRRGSRRGDAVASTPDLLAGVCARPAWSTRAARASRCCSTRCSKWSTAVRSPSPRSSTRPQRSPRTSPATTTCRACVTRSCTCSTRDDTTIPAFREAWAAIGDSIVVVGGDGIWNCHVHTNDIGAAVEAGIDAGRPHSIRVTDLMEQVEEERWVREAEVVADLNGAPPTTREPGHDRGCRGRRG